MLTLIYIQKSKLYYNIIDYSRLLRFKNKIKSTYLVFGLKRKMIKDTKGFTAT